MLTKTTKQIEEALDTSAQSGLTSAQVAKRLEENGYNELAEQKKGKPFDQVFKSI